MIFKYLREIIGLKKNFANIAQAQIEKSVPNLSNDDPLPKISK